MTTGRINQVTIFTGEYRNPPLNFRGGLGWIGERATLSALDTPGTPQVVHKGVSPSIVLLPPLSSPGDLPPCSEGASEQAPTCKAWAPKEEDTGGQPRPKADAD